MPTTPASGPEVATSVAGLLLGAAAAYKVGGRDTSVLLLVPLMVLGGLVGRAVGAAWQPVSSGVTVT